MTQRRYKIGIDVGGTFTHAVAVDAETLTVAGSSMVPTTHTAREGVARGVVESMHRLLEAAGIAPAEVVLIAHSTTQATNALLEGDVATVGIVGMGRGLEGLRARQQTAVDDIELAPGKFLKTVHRFLDTRTAPERNTVLRLLDEMTREGASVFVASEAFGVDDDACEQSVVAIMRQAGCLATAASEIARLYGLRVRTRTAVINASMMPKMLETAAMTERAVRESGIAAPLMIMRSDGGIMDVSEMRRRPILTMLSGPAAGVAAALMYVRVSDGIFLEVGGTSTDISLIRNGRPSVRSEEVGGHRLYVRTLDIRTVGIGGGSMPRLKGRHIHDVGPRSAHIAGLRYPSFASPGDCVDVTPSTFQPREHDPADYLILRRAAGGEGYAFTVTEAANIRGTVSRYGRAERVSLEPVAGIVAAHLHMSVDGLVLKVLDIAAAKVLEVVRRFAREERLERSHLMLVGGGGGAEMIVPHAARALGVEHRISPNAEVISAIGVALGMIQDTVERSVLQPTESDILAVRAEARQSVLRMGAAPDSVEVRVEVDTRQKRLIATAQGSPEMHAGALQGERPGGEELRTIAAASCGAGPGEVECVAATEFVKVYQARVPRWRLFGLLRGASVMTRVIGADGVIRLKLAGAAVCQATAATAPSQLAPMLEEFTTF